MIREDIKASLGQTICTEDIQDIVKIIEVRQDMILIIEVVTGIIQEVIKGMGIIIAIIEEVVIEIKIMIGTGVGHMKDRIETEETVEVHVIVDLDHVQGQVQIEIGLYVLSEGNMIILQENDLTRHASREVEQIQQMFNMDKDQTILQTTLMDTDKDEHTINLVETRDNLNL